MGFRALVFSALVFIYLIILASSHPIQKTLPSEFVQKGKIENKGKDVSKIEGGGAHGGNHGSTSHGNGNSASSSVGGGGALIPVYAGNAANKNRPRQIHRGAADCNLNRIKFSNMLMITLVYPLILLFLST
ncbi:hypothetical protein RJT34_25602 [Clitoria ternatea]|uniref:Uncharacterized protein n=1 Tax=Clitoria ternatea TaxID=43366 RepID=A0AAN9IH04_CLITE